MKISNKLSTDDLVFSERFIHSSGPGGQNVNKVATAVELRFDVDKSTILDEDVRTRIRKAAGSKLTGDGEIIIVSRKFRTQERNRTEARTRLAALVKTALSPPRKRKKTRKPRKAHQNRLDEKKRQSQKKRNRRKPPIE